MKPIAAKVEVEAIADLKPSESFGKVVTAIMKIFPVGNPFQHADSVILKSNRAEALSRIYDLIRSRQTIGVIRSRLHRNLTGDKTFLLLNKQAAFAGAIVVCDDDMESPLGPIKVTIRSPEILTVVDWIAPDLGKEH